MSQEINDHVENPLASEQPEFADPNQHKVELDLDDAPFLEDEGDIPPPPPQPLPSAAPAEAEETHSRKKLILVAVAGMLLGVLLVVVGVLLFTGGSRETVVEPPAVETEPAEPEIITRTMSWEPFWIQIRDTEGAVRFLTVRFSAPTQNEMLFVEMNAKNLILRDALFYYLRNQPILSLSDEIRVNAFKSEIMTVLNEHLASGKINEILIEEYNY